MTPPPRLSRLAREDFKEAPEWFGRFIDLLSPFLGSVTGALGGRLDTANIRKKFRSMTLTTQSTLAATFANSGVCFKNELGVKPQKVILAQVSSLVTPTAVIGPPIWDINEQGMIRILYIAGLSVSTKYELTFEVE